jgi:cyclopropane fatty-acyl-phospholipid synthase-like methyltransferase
MDRWKYFDITHRDHLICNPTGSAKLDEMIQLLKLPDQAGVLDIACGKAEFLVRLVERYGCSGVAVDLSPYTRIRLRLVRSEAVFQRVVTRLARVA